MFLVGLGLLFKDGPNLSLFLPYQYVKFNPNFKKLLSHRTLFKTRLILKHRRGKIDNFPSLLGVKLHSITLFKTP